MDEQPPTCDGATGAGEPQTWSPRTRRIISCLLIWHVCAVFIAPAAVDPASSLMSSLFGVFRPYLDALYLNHGYHFFAPEPGPSHLIRYELVLQDGSKKSGYFPNKTEHWPRLRYHRHFMLTEHLSRFTEDDVPPEYLQKLCQSYAQHLLAAHQADKVELILVRHLLPTPGQVLEGMRLTDDRLFLERKLGSFTNDHSEELPAVMGPAEQTAVKFRTVK